MRPAPRSRVPFLTVVRDSNFRTLWYAGTLTEVSRRLELLVLSWYTFQNTDSPFQLILVLVLFNLPRTMFSLFTGALADRFNRHHLLLAGQAVNTIIAAGILWLIGSGEMAAKYAFIAVFIQGTTRSLEDPVRRTAVFDIVGEGRLVTAMSLEVVSYTAGRVVGPILGGLLISLADFEGAYVCAVALHVLALVTLLRVSIPERATITTAAPVMRNFMVAASYALRNPILLGLFAATLIMNALAFPSYQLIPAVGRDHLGVGVALIGLLVASEGMGNVVSAAAMATIRITYHGRVYVLGSLALLVMLVLFAWSPWYALAFVFLFAGGVGQAGFSTMQTSITMLYAPPEMRGRMVGVQSLAIGVGNSLGLLLMGGVALVYDARWAISGSALAAVILLMAIAFTSPLMQPPQSQHPGKLGRD